MVHGILQVKILELVPSPGDLLDPRNKAASPALQANPLWDESQESPKGQPCPNSDLNPGPSD